jgi:6-phosphogluconate dehydrogenase
MEGGNADPSDTLDRHRHLRSSGARLLDVGVASGVDGALAGISASVGGDEDAFAAVAADLAAVSTTANGRSCCVRVGGGGTGHFVKMVHNGVEYTIMQLVAELVDVLRTAGGHSPEELGEALDRWNTDEFGSYVLQVAVDVLGHVDETTGRPFVDVVDDRAVQNGSGSRAGRSALALATPATLFAESSLARSLSCDVEMRQAFATHTTRTPAPAAGDLLPAGRAAFHAALLLTYAQAFRHVHAANQAYGWCTDLAEVAHSWRGATIRSTALRHIAEAIPNEAIPLLPANPEVRAQLQSTVPGLRRVVAAAVAAGVSTPCSSAALAYYDGQRTPRSSGAVVQALRSRLGGSDYRRTDRAGDFVLNWETKVELRT